MPNINIEFNKYLPSCAIFYGYYSILKSHKFIEDLGVDKDNKIIVLQNEEL